jgi:hypothetical protein
MVSEGAARRREFDAPRLSPEELNPERTLDRADALTERRLLHAQPFRGARDMAFFRDGEKVPEMPQV